MDWLRTRVSIDSTPETAIEAAAARIAARTGAITEAGGTLVRIANPICALRSANGR